MAAVLAYIKDCFLGIARGVASFFKSIVGWLKMAYSPNPYYRGNMLTALAVSGRPPFEGNLRMVISQVFQPSDWTVMEVSVIKPNAPPFRAVLKMFDRRFSPCVQGLRLRRGTGEWTPEFEREFIDYVRRGAAKEYLWRSDDDFEAENAPRKLNRLEEEVDRQTECETICNERASRLQSRMGAEKGIRLPKTYCTVRMAIQQDFDNRLLEVTGILMEYVPGFSCDLTEFASCEATSASEGGHGFLIFCGGGLH
ncbi:hypothetical protein CSUB01_06027 [Colletotrichum sublineola]|uniref:Uncharacterized protein n=1 Tax=Colletotrichum sublineola TaxID=1173701 RepID=A0A066X8C8_COLSU|nr:hypothetical protein CSUB01_06027 [Colletotrichum sublineola]